MEMLGGGEAIKEQCRSVDIMSDSAYAILKRDSRKCTGNFFIDDEVLREEGVTDMDKYTCVPGEANSHFCRLGCNVSAKQ